MAGIMERLRETSRELHDRAEHHPFQKKLARGLVDHREFGEYLQRLLRVHETVEGHLQRLAERDGALTGVLRPYQYKLPLIQRDLRSLNGEVQGIAESPACDRLAQSVRDAMERTPRSILGFHYVLEGSSNGTRFLARSLERSLGLTREAGLSYLDPYGDRQQSYWGQFKLDMDAVPWTEDEMDGMVRGACTMFEAMIEIADELGQGALLPT